MAAFPENMRPESGTESGFTLVAFMAILLPLIGLAGAAMLAMGTRSNRLGEEIRLEKALLAAEAGVDEARFLAAKNLLTSGASFSRTLPGGATFTVQATHLLSDSLDNDGDALTDESDEDVFELIVTGEFGMARRRFAAYLSPDPMLPVDAAVTLHAPAPDVDIDFDGSGFITGIDTNMDGSPGPRPAVPGLAIQTPGTVADLTSNYTVDDDSRITGAGGTPSHGVSTSTLDLSQVVADVQSNATIVLGDSHMDTNWGSPPSGPFHVFYRDGDIHLHGTIVGAGIMVVTGNVDIDDDFTFDGVMIVLGDIDADDDIDINGALIQGPLGDDFHYDDSTLELAYSSEAIQAAAVALGVSSNRYVMVSGWQEIARN